MFPINEGFSDYVKDIKRLIVKVDKEISAHPGIKQFIGLSRIDGKRMYELNPVYFYGSMDLASQLGVEEIQLVSAISSFV